MNKPIVFSFFAALIFAACTSAPKSYIIEGVVPDESYNNQMVYLYDNETNKQVDSTLVVDGKFTFTGSVDTAVIRRLVIDWLSANLILENGKIFVDMAAPLSAIGTPLNDGRSKYQTELAALIKESNEKWALIKQNQGIDEKTLNKLIDENGELYGKKIDSLCTVIFIANKNNALGTSVLNSTFFYLDPVRLDLLYAQAGDVVRKYKPLQKIIDRNAKALQTVEGMYFADFTIENGNRDGSKASLSDYVGKGKYVLVDFWASWCGPCIDEIPILVEVYNKYNGDKFEMLGVAVSDKLDASLKSLEDHKIPWSQILDAGNIPTELYGISGIPHIILFGPDGKIIARNLRGDGLKAKVAEVMQ